jgi:hypothetical protein
MQYQNSVAQPREELTDVIMEGITDDEQFIGLKLLPAAPLKLPNGHVPKIKIGSGNMMRASGKTRTPGASFDRWQSEIEDFNITLTQVSEEIQLPDEQLLVYEDYFAFESVYAKESGNRQLRGVEIDSEGAIFNTGTGYFDANNGTVAYSAANISTITSVLDTITAIRLVKGRGERPNTIAYPGTIYDRVRQSADMKSFIAGSINPGARVTPETIQAAFASMGIKQVLVSEAYVNQSQDGKNNSITPIYPLTYIFVGNASGGQLQAGGVGRTFYWEKEGPVLNVSSYRDEPRKSNVIRAMRTTVCAITNARAGTLIGTQVTT